MITTANRWGTNGIGIRFAKSVLAEFPIVDKTQLNVEVDKKNDRIIITRVKAVPKITLEELFEGFSGEYENSEEIKNWEQMPLSGREFL